MIMRLMLCTYCEKNHLGLAAIGMTALWKRNVNVNELVACQVSRGSSSQLLF